MVDNSLSTVDSWYGPGTDPNHVIRHDTVQAFLDQYGSMSNLSFAFGYFSLNAKMYDGATSSFNQFSTQKPFVQPFGNGQFLQAALNEYKDDVGDATKYSVAFQAIQSVITNDEVAGSTWDYVVVFMSDGAPLFDEQLYETTPGDVSLVTTLNQAVVAKGHKISVSTVYFGPVNAKDPINRLQQMAAAGNGQFVDTNTLGAGIVLNLADIIVVPGSCSMP